MARDEGLSSSPGVPQMADWALASAYRLSRLTVVISSSGGEESPISRQNTGHGQCSAVFGFAGPQTGRQHEA